VVLIEVFVNA